ncbi:MAG: ammonia channel protein, partial [Hyphomicrobium sp.]
MTSRLLARCALGLGALGALALVIDPALAQDAATAVKDAAAAAPAAAEAAPAAAPAAPVPNKGDTAFMVLSSVLVLLMTVPGLALFYGGLVRTKNMLSMFMQVFATLCLVAVIWVV